MVCPNILSRTPASTSFIIVQSFCIFLSLLHDVPLNMLYYYKIVIVV